MRHCIGDRREGITRFERLLELLKNRHVVLQSYSQREKTPPWFAYRADERRFGVCVAATFRRLVLAWTACEAPGNRANLRREFHELAPFRTTGRFWYRVPAGTFSPIERAPRQRAVRVVCARAVVPRGAAGLGRPERPYTGVFRSYVVTAAVFHFGDVGHGTNCIALFDSR